MKCAAKDETVRSLQQG